jgi:hypothetical protein
MRPNRLNAFRFAGILTAISLCGTTLLFTSSTFAADPPSIAGQWAIHQTIAGNENDQECTFTVADGKIAGTCKINEQTPKVTGAVDGKKCTWHFDIDYQGNTLTLTYVTSLDDADKFSGTVDVAPYGVSGDFTGQRAKTSK